MYDQIYQHIVNGDALRAEAAVRRALELGYQPGDILDQGMILAMAEAGRLFESEQLFVPELLLASRAMKAGLNLLRPYLATSKIDPVGTVIIGTASGDMHDIGKNLVAMMLEGAGFRVFDLGANVAPDRFVAAAREHRPQIVAVSALLTTSMTGMQFVVDSFREAGIRSQVKIMVGGAPLQHSFADQIGADMYAPTAPAAAKAALALLDAA